MKKAMIPAREKERLDKLHYLQILDSAPEEVFDELTRLAARLLNVPMAMITLIDENRQWFKSAHGIDVSETPRDTAFCAHTILGNTVMEVENALNDERFVDNPYVTGAPDLRFYAGAPLIAADGINLGSLCVIDLIPRKLSDEEKQTLTTLSKTVMRLITLRKINEEEKIFRRFFEMSPNILCVTDVGGRIRMLNHAFTNILGWTEEALQNRPLADFVVDADKASFSDLLQQLLASKNISAGTFRFKTHNNTFRWMQWTFNADSTGGDVFAVAHDITEIKQTQELLQQAKVETERLSAIKDVFLSNMSHEIRTPLNAINGFTDLLSKTRLSAEQQKYVDTVTLATQNLLVIINDILDVSKIETGIIQLEKTPVEIRKVIQHVAELHLPKARSKGLKIFTSLDPELPDWLEGDETRLIQILNNVVGNAVKFTAKGSVEIRLTSTSLSPQLARVRFEIKDTGIGIDAAKQKMIFDRFTQAEDSTTRLHGGTGLGLNIVKMLVELHRGELQVLSEPGKGTTFIFEIDFPVSEAPHQNELTPLREDLRDIKVLLVEDNEHNQLLAQTYLKRNFALVDTAGDGVQALEKLREKKYDVVLMDLQMPRMDGFMAMHEISNTLRIDVPVIACSAYSLVGEKDRCTQSGMRDYLAKPYLERELVTVIKNVLGREAGKITVEQDDVKCILGEFTKEEGEDFTNQMLALFLKRIPVDMEDIEKAIAEKNAQQLRTKAHLLAGSLSSFRFTLGTSLASKTEKLVMNNKAEEACEAAQDLLKYLNRTLNQVKEFLNT